MEARRVRDGTLAASSRSVQVVFDYAAQRTAPIPGHAPREAGSAGERLVHRRVTPTASSRDLRMHNPKGYARPELLVAPEELAARLGPAADGPAGGASEPAEPRPVLVDLRPAEAYAGGAYPGRGASRPFRHQPGRHRSGAARCLPLDSRPPAGRARRGRGPSGGGVRRAVRHPRGARLLVPGAVRPPRRADAGRRVRRLGSAPAGPSRARPRRRFPAAGRPAARPPAWPPGATCGDRLGRGDAGDPRHAQRRRAPRRQRARPAGRAPYPARSTSSGRATWARTARSSRLPSCGRCTRRPA